MGGPSQGVDESAVAAAKVKVGPAARESVRRARALVGQATALLNVSAGLRDEAVKHVGELAQRQARVVLGARPLTDLRGAVGKGVRIKALFDAGCRTVADVVDASAQQLEAVPGIGPQTAQQVSAAARVLAEQVRRDTRVRLDPDRRDPQHTRLLAILAAIRHADGVRDSLLRPVNLFIRQTAPLIEAAQPATSRAAMFFRGRSRKRVALAALAELDVILADPLVASLQQEVSLQERGTQPDSYDADWLWRDYAQHAAAYNTLLSTVGGPVADEESEAAQGFIPEELRQKINAEPLDTRLLTATLRGYQAFGAKYAIHQNHTILGDEMGLGKTVQALATMTHLAAKGQHRFLVVCPASVQVNWLIEIAAHTELTPHSLHGATRDAAARRWSRTGGVAVTTFNTIARLPDVTEADVAMLVVDEAHYVKNPESQRSQHVAAALRRAQRALFLTGTPMENRVEEFRNLVGYLQPAVARRLDPTDALAGARRFRRAVAPVYLRRNQEDVLRELPDKIEVEDWVQFTAAEEANYADAVGSRNLMQMRQVAFRAPGSAKLERLAEIVDEAREDGLKVLVFSQFLDVLDRIQHRLGEVVQGPLTGAVPPRARQDVIDAFTRRDGHAVLLAQIEAGGVGLNVQAASVVIIAEPQWKPSTEDQAIARAFRMGQVRKVQVHRLLAKGSVDERMREVQAMKSLLFSEFARKSDAKEADGSSMDTGVYRPEILDDDAVPMERRIILAEQHRLGLE